MAVATGSEVKAGNGRAVSQRLLLEAGEPWRFVLIVQPQRTACRGGEAVAGEVARPALSSVLEPALVRRMGPGATLLVEPFEPTVKIRFDWPARTQAEAIAAAIVAVESFGLRVLRVDNDDCVTAADIAHRVGRSRETVRLWAVGTAGPGGFPPPVNPRRGTTFYSWAEMLPWLRERRGEDLPEEQPALVAADLVLRLRALLDRVPLAQALLDLLDRSGPTAPGRAVERGPGTGR